VRLRDEGGQALVLALAFLTFAGLVIAATLTYAYASELTTQRLSNQRDTTYTADGATDAAVQMGRLDPTLGAYGDPRCQATEPTSAPAQFLLTTTSPGNDGTSATVVCTWSQDPLFPDRTVTFATFVASQTAPVVKATVTYADRSVSGTPPVPATVSAWTYCTHGPVC
jgi:hypothetical protein